MSCKRSALTGASRRSSRDFAVSCPICVMACTSAKCASTSSRRVIGTSIADAHVPSESTQRSRGSRSGDFWCSPPIYGATRLCGARPKSGSKTTSHHKRNRQQRLGADTCLPSGSSPPKRPFGHTSPGCQSRPEQPATSSIGSSGPRMARKALSGLKMLAGGHSGRPPPRRQPSNVVPTTTVAPQRGLRRYRPRPQKVLPSEA